MIEIEYFEKLLALLKTIEDDQNININIQRKLWPLILFDTALYRYIVIFIDTFPITTKYIHFFSHDHSEFSSWY